MVDNENSRTIFDTKLNLSYLMKPRFFVLFWSVYDGNFGQIMLEVTNTNVTFRKIMPYIAVSLNFLKG